ncbi:unnamed protein product [Lota lota]
MPSRGGQPSTLPHPNLPQPNTPSTKPQDQSSPLVSKYEHHDANTEECPAACGRGTGADARPGQSGPERAESSRAGSDGARTAA